jgi:HSP20 family protein
MAIFKKQNEKQAQQSRPQSGQLVRKEPAQGARNAFDPLQVMREWMRWDPFREMAPLVSGDGQWSPDFDVRETKDSYVFTADVPGVKTDDLDISILGNRLQVSGKREEEEEVRDDTFYACERSYGSFMRTFTLPETADTEHITSKFSDGVLTLVVPKAAESKARKIQIGSGEKH